MAKLNAAVICGHGTNCQLETAHCARLAGFEQVDIVHFADLVSGAYNLLAYKLAIFPGGFLDGDNLGAAQAASVRWRFLKNKAGAPLLDILKNFLANNGLVLGICNGFQLLAKLGILPGFNQLDFTRSITLGKNDEGKFEDRWVRLYVNPHSNCVFTKNLPPLYLPVRHGEGKVIASKDCLKKLQSLNLVALQYACPKTGKPTEEYPHNPNGSPMGIAGITDITGHILGLMPHPEAFHHAANHPGFTRGEYDAPGTLLFANAARYLKNC